MTKEEATRHNQQVIKKVMVALVESGFADPVRMMLDEEYTYERIASYMKAANIVREAMGMPQLVLYDIEEN